MRCGRSSWHLPLGILAAVVAFYGPAVALGLRLFFTHEGALGHVSPGSDLWHLNYPLRHFYAAQLRELSLPHWCPTLGTGQPLLAEGELGALSPINLLLHALLPLPLALNWSMLLPLVLGGTFAALLARELGAGRLGAALTGIVFALSGFEVTHLKHIAMIQTAACAPIVLWVLERHHRAWSLRATAALAAAVALAWISGHPQIAYYTLVVAGLYALCGMVRLVWDGAGRGAVLRFGGGSLGGVVLGCTLAAPQLLPTLELHGVGPRRETSCRFATWNDYPPAYARTMLVPHALGDPGALRPAPPGAPLDPLTRPALLGDERLVGFQPTGRANMFWEITGYVGIAPLLLALSGLSLSRRRLGMALVLGVSGLVVLGEHAGLVRLFCQLPGFTAFRHHTRFLLFVDLSLAVLAGLGATRWIDLLARRRRPLGLALGGLLVAVCFLDLRVRLGDHNPTIEPARWLEPPGVVRRIREAEAGRSEPFRVAVLDTAGFAFANAYFLARGWKGDLAPYDRARELLYPNANVLHGLSSLNQRLALYPEWTDTADQPWRLGHAALSLYNVRYVIAPHHPTIALPTPHRPDETRLRLVATLPGDRIHGLEGRYEIRLYENPDVLPRAFLVPRARIVPNAAAAMTAPGFDPRREVLLSWDGRRPPSLVAGASREPIREPVIVLADEPQRVRLRVRAPERAWLFSSDTYYPGWEARIDGAPAPIYRANQAGRAIEVPAGEHEVELRYRPGAFRRGLVVAAAALLVLVGGLLWGRRRARAPRSDASAASGSSPRRGESAGPS